MSKDLLFYSNYCDFCKEIINTMIKKNIRNRFLLVCVDTRKYDIPSFIDRVPTILIVGSGETVTDENLYKYLDSLSISSNQQNEDISPMYTIYGNSLYSSSFSSLNDEEVGENKNYVFLGSEQHIDVPNEDKTNKKNGNEGIEKGMFEKYLESRKNDDSYIKKILDSNNNGNRIM